MIDRLAIEERRAALEAQRVALEGQINAVLGAIQDCDYWLAQLEPEVLQVPEDRVLRAVGTK